MNVKRVQNKAVMIYVCLRCMLHVLKVYVCVLHKGVLWCDLGCVRCLVESCVCVCMYACICVCVCVCVKDTYREHVILAEE